MGVQKLDRETNGEHQMFHHMPVSSNKTSCAQGIHSRANEEARTCLRKCSNALQMVEGLLFTMWGAYTGIAALKVS